MTYPVPSRAKLEVHNLWIFSARLRHFQLTNRVLISVKCNDMAFVTFNSSLHKVYITCRVLHRGNYVGTEAKQYSVLDKSTPSRALLAHYNDTLKDRFCQVLKLGESSILRRWEALIATTSSNMARLTRSPPHPSQFPIHVLHALGPSLPSDRPVDNNIEVVLSLASSVLDYPDLPFTANRSLSLMFSHK